MAAWRGIAWVAILFAATPCHAAPLSIMAEDAAEPFAAKDGSGYADDIVRAAFRAVGTEIKLDIVPYARCKNSVQEGKVPACFAMSWDPAMTGKIAFSHLPIFQVYADLFLPGRTERRKDRLPPAPGSVIGVINDYEYPGSIQKLQARGVRLKPAPDDYANLNMLAHGRLDGAVVMTNDLEQAARKAIAAGVEHDIHFGYRFGVEKSYIGFSLSHPSGEWARNQFDTGYGKILHDGTVAAIRRKWTLRLNMERTAPIPGLPAGAGPQ
jgi:polar amino acid transport system substrate-binding protein